MRLLIVHLSDLHFTGDSPDPVGRATAVIDAVKNLEPAVDGVAVTVTGDIALFGQESEYMTAMDFHDSINRSVDAAFPGLPFVTVAVPGNHDCDFTDSDTLRDVVLQNLTGTHRPREGTPDDLIEVCAGILKLLRLLGHRCGTAEATWGSAP